MKPWEAGRRNGLADSPVIQLLGVVDLVPAGNAAGVKMGDVGDVLFDGRADVIFSVGKPLLIWRSSAFSASCKLW